MRRKNAAPGWRLRRLAFMAFGVIALNCSNNQGDGKTSAYGPTRAREAAQQHLGDADQGPVRDNDLNNAAYFGYQCWHFAKGDGRDSHPDIRQGNWVHWFNNPNVARFENIHGDFWPDFSDYEKNGVPLYETDMRYPNGNVAKVYSCWDYETVDLHIKWMALYGLKGVFFQRQALRIHSPAKRAESDQVVLHLWRACEKYKVKFSMMPCNNYKASEDDDAVQSTRQSVVDNIITDWRYLVDELRLPDKPDYRMIDSPMYMHQEDRKGIKRPVVGLWGLGQDNRPMTAGDAEQIVAALHNQDDYHAYIMGGVPTTWRTEPKSLAWASVYKQLDMISPWRTVFAIKSADDVQKRMRDDMKYCQDKGIDYGPVVSPGASTRHMLRAANKRNWQPRLAGQFLWNQAYEVTRAYDYVEGSRRLKQRSLPRFMYFAMFDEIDEGTALYKQAATSERLPVNDTGDPTNDLVTLNEDGKGVSSDFYLRLGRAARDMLVGSRRPTDVVPIPAH